MKYIKYLLIIMLISSFILVSCKKDSTTGPGGDSIVGTWTIMELVFGWVITTNSNQVASIVDDVSGQLNIIGTHTITLDFMYLDSSTDSPSFWIYNTIDNNQYSQLYIDGSTNEGTFTYYDNSGNTQTFKGVIVFTFNGTTLTVTQSTLTDVDGTATITASGTLTFSFNNTNIEANTPTLIQDPSFFGDVDENGSTTIEINNDGTLIITEVYDGETFTETWTFTTSGNQITIKIEDYFETYEYSVSGNTMSWVANNILNICDDYETQSECFTPVERELGLASGSLTAVDEQLEIIFNKTTTKRGFKIGRKFNLINPAKEISYNMQKIKNLKKSM